MKKKRIDPKLPIVLKEQNKSSETTEISEKEEAILQKIASILVDLVIEEQKSLKTSK